MVRSFFTSPPPRLRSQVEEDGLGPEFSVQYRGHELVILLVQRNGGVVNVENEMVKNLKPICLFESSEAFSWILARPII